jgi:hypothetical protein
MVKCMLYEKYRYVELEGEIFLEGAGEGIWLSELCPTWPSSAEEASMVPVMFQQTRHTAAGFTFTAVIFYGNRHLLGTEKLKRLRS